MNKMEYQSKWHFDYLIVDNNFFDVYENGHGHKYINWK